ncbi:gp11 [Klebsiella pneumoniae subsp. ozaenae]|uniref:Gp11 n=1 Tax=Klebsiella pneumoniae subsp. ozaenae TaxID=574 RepID=A0A378ABW4_KLEPO|nr:gp11 [Klebsiella pneumoniae subsp. ozaenae]
MITTAQDKEYLDSVGIKLPDFILAALVEQVNSIQECLDAHYSPATALLIQSYLLGLMALGQGDKYISSHTAPSGASESFRYQSFTDRWKGTLNLLRVWTNTDAPTSLIPPDPNQYCICWYLDRSWRQHVRE